MYFHPVKEEDQDKTRYSRTAGGSTKTTVSFSTSNAFCPGRTVGAAGVLSVKVAVVERVQGGSVTFAFSSVGVAAFTATDSETATTGDSTAHASSFSSSTDEKDEFDNVGDMFRIESESELDSALLLDDATEEIESDDARRVGVGKVTVDDDAACMARSESSEAVAGADGASVPSSAAAVI